MPSTTEPLVIFSRKESQLNLIQIEEIEKYVGLNFPREYRDHLLKITADNVHQTFLNLMKMEIGQSPVLIGF